jgi:DNA-binding winged helix-turn-helix (wHTH) protein/pimeloyl-ACP methyl ester carboxylesterase
VPSLPAIQTDPARVFSFDDFVLDMDAFELRRGGVPLPLEPQVIEVLAVLVENEGRVVTKDELLDRVWPERYVTEAALNSRVMSARKALGDSGQQQRYIKTVHGRGYRFVGGTDSGSGNLSYLRPVGRPAGLIASMESQTIRYARTDDGHDIAYAISGQGTPLVRVLGWFTHVDLEWRWPALREFWARLGRMHSLIRFDGRGMGLSSDTDSFSIESRLKDLEAVVDHAGLERFALLGMCEGADTAIHYAAKHPDRVTRLVTYGAGPSGPNDDPEWTGTWHKMMQMISYGWDNASPVYRQLFAHLFLGSNATGDAVRAFDELQRASVSGARARRYLESLDPDRTFEEWTEEIARGLNVPTMVVHRSNDPLVPRLFSRRLASLIPGADYVSLEGDARWLMVDPCAIDEFVAAIERFTADDGDGE